tara:strand:+ start:48 stop:971 length:924 start_codon:yes stop_codon:yes gene_type:complete
MNDIPWVEKYRPKLLDGVILNKYNKNILNSIIIKRHFPNLLFYGPPGTGKTTTMVNLIDLYQKDIDMKKSLIIHLNASDERGIDTIRHQISLFVNSNGLFSKGLKFIILDEVDYMTKSAQLGLKYLIENSNENIRYCLICNYISKIDKSLQNSFIKLKFNSLPENEIVVLLRDISINEKLNLDINKLIVIQKYFDSDIRSMINYMQTNKLNVNLIDNNILDNLIDKEITLEELKSKINKISIEYNIDRYCLIKDYIKYIITNKKILITLDNIGSLECIIRGLDVVNNSNLDYIFIKLLHLIKLLDSE